MEGFEGLDQWDTLVDTSGVRSPEVYAALSYQAFTMIYGLFPINTVQYLRRVFGEDQELDLAKPILVVVSRFFLCLPFFKSSVVPTDYPEAALHQPYTRLAISTDRTRPHALYPRRPRCHPQGVP